MPIDNAISVSFTQQEETDIHNALSDIENIIKDKVINLTPKERQVYAKIGDETENFVKKTTAYIDQSPELVPIFVNTTEMKKDIEARKVINPILKRISIIQEQLEDTHIIIGNDLYKCIMGVYRNIRLLSKQNVPGITSIYDDLKKQFPRSQ